MRTARFITIVLHTLMLFAAIFAAAVFLHWILPAGAATVCHYECLRYDADGHCLYGMRVCQGRGDRR